MVRKFFDLPVQFGLLAGDDSGEEGLVLFREDGKLVIRALLDCLDCLDGGYDLSLESLPEATERLRLLAVREVEFAESLAPGEGFRVCRDFLERSDVAVILRPVDDG